MKKTYLFLIFCFVFLLASCSSKPEDLIIGKWQKIDGTGTIEFFKDGTVSITGTTGLGKKSGAGTFKFVDDSHLRLEGLGIVVKISLSQDELTLTDPEGNVSKYRRGKWFE